MAIVDIKPQEKFKGNYMDAHEGKISFIDLDTGESLGLMGLPRELATTPETTFATIKPFGRSNPHYHVTGGEDTIELDISWWAAEEDRIDIVQRCKWLESMSKADGYLNRQHYIHLAWGSLFRDATWIVTAAPYVYTDFDKTRGMRPNNATQKVTLKRVVKTSRTTADINNWRS